MHEWPHAVRDADRAAAATCEGLLATGDDQSTRNYEAEQCNGPRRADMAAGRRRRRVRQEISIGVKMQILRLRDANITWPSLLRQLPVPVTKRIAEKIMKDAAIYRAMPNDARTLSRNNRRAAKWPELDALVYEWYLAVYALGHRRIPITTALLQEAENTIAGRLGITEFSASQGWVRGFLKRFDICNVALHGHAAEVILALATAAMEGIRRMLEAYPPYRIYNMDETGLLYRRLPSRSYVPRRDRRHARGTKALRHMDRITLALCTNATGTYKLPVEMIGEPVRPLRFRGVSNECPLPYFNQKKAWMDKDVYAKWWNTVFLPALRERHGGA